MLDKLFDNNNSLFKRISFGLFVVFLLEIMLGGGGRLFGSGIFSIRTYLFFALLLITLPLFIKQLLTKQVDKNIIILSLIYTVVLLIGIIVARFNNNNNNLIFIDIKPLSFFYAVIFIYLFIKEQKQIELIKILIKFSSLLMAIAYLICFLLLNIETEWFDPIKFISYIYSLGEFFPRGSIAFAYKGFFYLCVGFVFWWFDKKKYSKYIAGFIFIAIFLTLTRGFLIAIILAFLFYYITNNLKNIKKILIAIFGSVLCLFFLLYLLNITFIYLETNSNRFNENTLNEKKNSNQERFNQIQDVINEVSYSSIIQGHGFGKGVKSRNMRMEISYLEIFHKQGLIGLAMWAYLFSMTVLLYRKLMKINCQKEADPFLVSMFFAFMLSLTNPYINNPIGLTIIIITIVYFNILLNKNKNITV